MTGLPGRRGERGRAPRPHQLPRGTVVEGLYEIVGTLGIGGMAIVYEAVQRDSGQRVALKAIDPGLEKPAALKRRFFNELLLATRIRHPNVVEILDFGLTRDTGVPYIVMERLDGCSLRGYLRDRGPLPERRAVPLFLGALSALRIAHELGVVHKDLKPSNLFLSRVDTVEESMVVLDFGIAGRVSPSEGDAPYSGTPQYSAPEYMLEKRVAPPVDVYQVGLALAEALTGQPLVPTRDPTQAYLYHVQGRIELPAALSHTALGDVLRRALARDPDARYPDAGRLQDALAEATTHPRRPVLRHTDPPAPVRRRAHQAPAEPPEPVTPPPAAATTPASGMATGALLAGAGFLLGALATWLVMQ